MAAVLEKSRIPPAVNRLYTADDLLQMPENERFELVRGELVPMSPPPGEEHGDLADAIGSYASVHARENNLGRTVIAETGFKIEESPDTVRAPDWAFTRKERLRGPSGKKHSSVVPDIVLEVRSPSDSRGEFVERIAMWIAAGVTIVWALDPAERRLDVHREHEIRRLGPKDTLTGEEILPGFELPLRKVFGGQSK